MNLSITGRMLYFAAASLLTSFLIFPCDAALGWWKDSVKVVVTPPPAAAWGVFVAPGGNALYTTRGGFFDSSDEYDEQEEQQNDENTTVKEDDDGVTAEEEKFEDAYQELPPEVEEEHIEIVVGDDNQDIEVPVEQAASGEWETQVNVEKVIEEAEMADEEDNEEEDSDENEATAVEVESFVKDEEVEAAETVEESTSFATETVVDDPSIDDDSSAFVDRMELADAYDEGETTPGSFEVESAGAQPQEESPVETEAPSTQSAAPAVIDAAVRKILLKELNYRRNEVNSMKPAIAAMVVEKRLQRPEEGIPKNFIRTDLQKRPALVKMLPKIVAGGALVAAAVMTGSRSEFLQDSLESARSFLFEETLGSVSSSTSATVEPSVEYSPEPPVEEEDDDSIKNVNEHTDLLGDVHPHSVKPGQVPNDQLDVTWLDKAITFVENKFKAFFRMEI